jgi:hypothetical protein
MSGNKIKRLYEAFYTRKINIGNLSVKWGCPALSRKWEH